MRKSKKVLVIKIKQTTPLSVHETHHFVYTKHHLVYPKHHLVHMKHHLGVHERTLRARRKKEIKPAKIRNLKSVSLLCFVGRFPYFLFMCFFYYPFLFGGRGFTHAILEMPIVPSFDPF